MSNSALAFTAYANQREVVALDDGRLAAREYNARKGVHGWMVYGQSGAREAFLTDAQFAKMGAGK